ncbi:uncharacterized protein KY384_003364 [Bacidia gigantensis]|uniref:uncharacterized protein n=1 Tax=Bacidia gigantensis TaxID=2732470 RepID=UPI001D04941C|nr:uncharacterized protein KY384_003364 [Bacidia gigantensis]KAG8531732.1 hypothetical protein KY384_003364 [Bacidia gigantensis]
MTQTDDSYLIIGAGVFGASTALHLIRKYPNSKIRLVDREPFPPQNAASWDLNKVVRADYDDIFYTEKALEAKELWRWDPLFKPFYHESGIFWISDAELASKISDNYKKLNAKEDFRLVSLDEAKTAYDGMFEAADYSGVSQILINKSSGWAEAKEALKATIQASVDAGVEYTATDIVGVEFDKNGACIGARSKSEEMFRARKTILCTGAGTARLLADSSPYREDIQVDGRLVAAGICTGFVELNDKLAEEFSKAPVGVQDLLPGRGGSLPPTVRHELKYWRDVSVRNSIKHASGQVFSAPPDKPLYDQWEVPQTLKDEVRYVSESLFGKREDLKISNHRLCWESVTPSNDFIISAHPRCAGLHVATGGSFHGWKFLPILGKYVLQMLDGTIDPALAKRWAWDRENLEPDLKDSFVAAA